MIYKQIVNTKYGPKAECVNDKGETKQYTMSPLALQKAMSFTPGLEIWAKWGKDQAGYVFVEEWTNIAPIKKPYTGSGGSQAYDPKTFVSNVVGQAIASKAIISPDQIDVWAKAAWKAINSLAPAVAAEGIALVRAAVAPQQAPYQAVQQPPQGNQNPQGWDQAYPDFNDDIPAF
jgi:hypothetical protein